MLMFSIINMMMIWLMQGGWLEQKGGKEVKASFMLTDDDKRLTDEEDDRGENDKP